MKLYSLFKKFIVSNTLLRKLVLLIKPKQSIESGFYTHRPFLKNELSKIDYSEPVLCMEFGTGPGSAEVFKQFTNTNQNLTVIAFETDKTWYKQMKDTYETDRYKFIFVDNWDKLLTGFDVKSYGFNECKLAFVDQHPWEARINTMDTLQDVTNCFVLHDYDYYNKGLIQDIFKVDSHSFFKKYLNKFNLVGNHKVLPPTLVMIKKNPVV
jgi:hypothetical protein